MKRIKVVLLFLGLAIGFCFWSGCSKKQDREKSGEPIVITLWNYYNGPQKSVFEQMVNEFNETKGQEKGIVIESLSQGNVNELTEKVMDSANNKVGAPEIPDIFAAYADTAYQLDQMDLIANLTPYLTETEIKEYIPAYIEEGQLGNDKEIKIFPIAKSTEVLMLNRTDWDKFASETGANLDSLKTIEGVAEIAKKYYDWTDLKTEKLYDGKAFFGRDAMANYFIIGSKQLGVEIFSVQDGKVTLNCEEDVIKKLWDNFYVPYVNGYFGAYGKFRSDDAKTGDIIALVGSTSGAAYFPSEVIIDDSKSYPIVTSYFPAPCFKDGKYCSVQQGAGIVVTKSDKERESGAVEFLKWFTEEERNIEFAVESGYMPVKKSANKIQLINNALKKIPASPMKDNLSKAITVAIEVVNDSPMYTNKAFKNGTMARGVLENSMMNQAKQDLEEINNKISQGSKKEEVISQYTTQEHFEKWFELFKQQLLDAIEV